MVKNLLKNVMSSAKASRGEFDGRAFVDAIEQGYVTNGKPTFKQKKSFAPSSLVYGSGECARYWFFAFNGGMYQDSFTPAMVANMRNGTKAHERIQEAVAKTDLFISAEQKVVHNDPPIFGFLDLDINWNGQAIPVEIKTARDISFQRRKDSKEPMSYHKAQLLIYMYILDRPLGVILYENKDTQELLPIIVKMTEENKEWVEQTFAWMRQVYDNWKNGALPIKLYRSNSKICKSCPVKTICDQAGAGLVHIDKLEQLG